MQTSNMVRLQFLRKFISQTSLSIEDFAKKASIPLKKLQKYLDSDDAPLSEMYALFEKMRFNLIPFCIVNGKKYKCKYHRTDFLKYMYDASGWDGLEIEEYLEKDDIPISKICELCDKHCVRLNFGVVEGFFEDHFEALFNKSVETCFLCRKLLYGTDKFEELFETDKTFRDFLYSFFNSADVTLKSNLLQELNRVKILSTYSPDCP